jgi:hypothetical protein
MTSYYIGNYNLSDNSKPIFDVDEDYDENYTKSSFNYNKYHKSLRYESISSATYTFIYLNKREITMYVSKNPSKFKHLINNSVINKYF